MVAVDTSTLIAFLEGESGKDVTTFIEHLKKTDVFIPQLVVSEILSDATLTTSTLAPILALPRLLIEVGFWERAGVSRSKVLAHKRKARLADTLIAQSCIDHRCALITRDGDFKNFARYCGLELVR